MSTGRLNTAALMLLTFAVDCGLANMVQHNNSYAGFNQRKESMCDDSRECDALFVPRVYRGKRIDYQESNATLEKFITKPRHFRRATDDRPIGSKDYSSWQLRRQQPHTVGHSNDTIVCQNAVGVVLI